jgi:hypothetical protein
MTSPAATKQDIDELKRWILEREISAIRWSVGALISTQIAYFVITLSTMYFMLQHLLPTHNS